MVDLAFVEKRIRKLMDRNSQIKKELEKAGHSVPKAFEASIKTFNTKVENIKDLKIACVMDRFTMDCYTPECNILQLTPENWKEEITGFEPDLLFIESAWEGKDKLWYRKIANGSEEFFEMASFCQEKQIPIVFWNKEDPVYTDTFMPVARMADFVFTTDIDCIKKYKTELRKDEVYHLHFAAQPKVHNPIEKFQRKDKYCFAGAYYHKYKKRAEVFDSFAEIFTSTKGFDIYDRNYQNSLPEHAFPKSYNPYILGKLDSSEIDVAYKGYNFGINMNSVDQSQTMFARRVFEMLASNTVTIGNYSRGVKNLFGDLTICTNDKLTLEKDLDRWCKDETTYRKYRLLGLRSVLSQHLYEDRLSYIAKKVFGKDMGKKLPMVNIVAKCNGNEEIEKAISVYKKQSYKNTKLYIIASSLVEVEDKNIIFVENSNDFKIKDLEGYISNINVKNYYGENYLLDMVLSLRYGDFSAIGKGCFYSNANGNIAINTTELAYKSIDKLIKDRAIICTKEIELSLEEFLNEEFFQCENMFCVDEFNFCENYNGDNCTEVDDLFMPDKGLSMEKIQNVAEGIKREFIDGKGQTVIAETLMKYCREKSIPKEVKINIQNQNMVVNSTVKEGENQYIYFENFYNVVDCQEDNNINFTFNGVGGLDILGVCIFYDGNKNKLSPAFPRFNRFTKVEIPSKAKFFKLGIRVSGKGDYKVSNITIGENAAGEGKSCFLSRSNVLVLSNHYPSPEEIYRNMFVHKRMTTYKGDGYVYDIMRMNIYAKSEYREFEGINVVEGQAQELENILATGYIDTVCVHFLDRNMWEVLKGFSDKIRIIVWSHGADIQPWWRRDFNFTTEEDLEKGKKESEERMKLWNEVFSKINDIDIQFVFVSKYSADIVMEDYNIKLSEEKYNIIHNCIDTSLFEYKEKDGKDRLNIVSIRPYASKIYGNDITVKVIEELSKKDFFNELTFTIMGNGDLFEEITKPLKKYKNVLLEKTFLRQHEIVDIYNKNGVVLIPTRGDTQGVSRDEAMSCGLVAITNGVGAIPEFVDDECGIVVPAEDYKAMAESIEKLYNEPEYFAKLSVNAAKRVRSQTSKEFTIDKEIILIENR